MSALLASVNALVKAEQSRQCRLSGFPKGEPVG
jgi:hypothetical protein